MSKLMNVPDNIITGKDLDYLSDMFQWNYISFKKTCFDIENVSDDEIIEIFGDACDLFENNLTEILDILDNPGGDIDE